VGAGAVLVASGALAAGLPPGGLLGVAAPALGTGFTAITGGLLVWDLKRPDRFFYIFTKSNPRSWLFLGSICLAGLGAVSGGWLAAAVAESAGLPGRAALSRALTGARWMAAPAAISAAGYTAFLFDQAEGRDLWQSRMLLVHLVIQAVQTGGGALLALAPLVGAPPALSKALARTFVAASAASAAVMAGEYGRRHPTANGEAAARMIIRGRHRRLFWSGAVGLGALAAGLAVPAMGGRKPGRAAVGGLLAQAAVLAYETVFVRAGQDVPLS
jgi:formate-dependent nitrite reductase membrane component NrfD